MLRVFYSFQVNYKAQNVQVMTFGQPRIGNSVFASFYSNIVPNTFRVTHEHDIVPHLPPFYSYLPRKTYHHFPREVCFIDTLNYTELHRCDNVDLIGAFACPELRNKQTPLLAVPFLLQSQPY